MNKIVATIVLMLCTLVANAGNDANIPATASPVKIRIIGDIDTASRTSSLWIIRQNDNIRNPAAEVPIVNGKIDYTFQTSEPDMFSMISKQDLFNGSWMNFDFFAEDGEIHISGKENENKKLELKLTRTTTPLNRQLIEYIEDRNLTFYPRMDSISELINQIPRDECYSPAGKAFWQEFETLSECIKQHPDSLLLLQLRSDMYKKSMEMEKERTMRSAEYYRLSDASRDINNERMEYETEKYGTPDGNLFAMSVLFKNFMWY